MASDAGSDSRAEGEPPRLGQWKSFQNPYPDLPNPHLPQKPQVSLTREELRVLQECNRESFWYRSLPACLFCVGVTQFAVNKGYIKPHPKYGSGLKVLGASLLGYILGKLSYQNECRQKILALPNSQLAETLRQRAASRNRSPPSEFAPESADSGPIGSFPQPPPAENSDYFDSRTEPPPVDLSTGNAGEQQESQFKSYGDRRRQNREIYNDNQIVKWQNMPNRAGSQPPPTSQTPEDKGSQWKPPTSSTQQRGPTNKYGDLLDE